jgi:hypothetical protein
MSMLLKMTFMFKCTLPMLRLTTMLPLLSLPIVLTRLLCHHQHIRPPSSLLVPTFDAIVLSTFPIAWFFGFLYYTEVPSLVFVVWTIVAASQERHWLAGLVCAAIPRNDFRRSHDGSWGSLAAHFAKQILSGFYTRMHLANSCSCGLDAPKMGQRSYMTLQPLKQVRVGVSLLHRSMLV